MPELQTWDGEGWGAKWGFLRWDPQNEMTVGMWHVAPRSKAKDSLVTTVSWYLACDNSLDSLASAEPQIEGGPFLITSIF